ncbi:MAG: nucleoside triphosphate pyrophosphohydrolase [Tissierellia bacterium]|nr:nucleoside triphosphate pyrophosphohydrolase [Tissierellia bacterium]
MEKIYKKLVRDNIPEIIRESGKECIIETMEDKEYERELNNKLLEEVEEYIESESVEEIADILEVIYAILEFKNIPVKEVEEIRLRKRKERGGFERKIKLIKVMDL